MADQANEHHRRIVVGVRRIAVLQDGAALGDDPGAADRRDGRSSQRMAGPGGVRLLPGWTPGMYGGESISAIIQKILDETVEEVARQLDQPVEVLAQAGQAPRSAGTFGSDRVPPRCHRVIRGRSDVGRGARLEY